MPLEKQKVALSNTNTALSELEMGGKTVFVKNYLSIVEQGIVAGVYLDVFMKDSDPSKVIRAEHELMLAVLYYCTNIKTTSETNDALLEFLLSNFSQWERITKEIKNYSSFRALLHKTVEEVKEEKRNGLSFGKQLEDVSNKILDFISKLSSADGSPEFVERMQNLLKQINESPILQKMTEIK
jgi:hypothetical protein